jgi:hypothetical protein
MNDNIIDKSLFKSYTLYWVEKYYSIMDTSQRYCFDNNVSIADNQGHYNVTFVDKTNLQQNPETN